MKKVIFCLILIFMPAVAVAQQEFIFKEGIGWGTKLSQVASLEKPAAHQNNYIYIIDTGDSAEGLDTTLAYFFTSNDKLAQIAEIYDNYDYKRLPIANQHNFNRVRNDLIDRFGLPTIERVAWPEPSDKIKFNNDNIAGLLAGKAEMISSWNLPDTDIMLNMSLRQDHIRIIAIFQSREYIDQFFKEDSLRRKQGTIRNY